MERAWREISERKQYLVTSSRTRGMEEALQKERPRTKTGKADYDDGDDDDDDDDISKNFF